VAAALQIEPKPDVVIEVVDQLGFGLGEADDAENTNQYRPNDDYGPRLQIRFHGSLEPA
jgi:hypothetical protein